MSMGSNQCQDHPRKQKYFRGLSLRECPVTCPSFSPAEREHLGMAGSVQELKELDVCQHCLNGSARSPV